MGVVNIGWMTKLLVGPPELLWADSMFLKAALMELFSLLSTHLP